MTKHYILIPIVLLIILFQSCFEPDGIQPYDPPENFVVDLPDFSTSYAFLSLENYHLEHRQKSVYWHLKFSNLENQWAVFSNPCIDIQVAKWSENNFERLQLSDTISIENWEYDATEGVSKKSAFGLWGDFKFSTPKSYQSVYIIKLSENNYTYFFKIKFLNTEANKYVLHFSDFSSDDYRTIEIPKRGKEKYSYLNLFNPENTTLLETSSPWNLQFTMMKDSLRSRSRAFSGVNFPGEIACFPTILLKNTAYSSLNNINFDSVSFGNAQIASFQKADFIPLFPIEYSASDQTFTFDNQLVYLLNSGPYFYKMQVEKIQYFSQRYIRFQLKVKRL